MVDKLFLDEYLLHRQEVQEGRLIKT